MKKLVNAAFYLLLLAVMFSTVTPALAADPQAVLEPNKTSLNVGEEVTVSFVVKNVVDLYGIQYALEFDVDKLQYVRSSHNTSDYNNALNFERGVDGYKCNSCEHGYTHIYPLTSVVAGSKELKARVWLADFTFKAKKPGMAEVKLTNLVANNSQVIEYPDNRPDNVMPIHFAQLQPLTIIVNAGNGDPGNGGQDPGNGGQDPGNGGQDPGNGGQDPGNSGQQPNPPGKPETVNTNLQKQLDEILADTNINAAISRLVDLLGSFKISNPGEKKQLEKAVSEMLDKVLAYTTAETVQKNGKTYFTFNTDTLKALIQDGQMLQSAADEAELEVVAYVNLVLEESGAVNISLTSEMMAMLSDAGLGFAVKLPGATIRFPISSIYNGGEEDAHFMFNRTNGNPFTSGGAQYRPYAIYDLEAFHALGDNETRISSFKVPVIVTAGYPSDELDAEKVGFYYYNEATQRWEYIRGKNDLERHTVTVTLSHFSRYAVMEYSKRYSDLENVYDAAVRAIEVLSARNVVNGIDETHFAPRKSMTRAEFVAVLARVLDWELASYNNSFKDVNAGEWYADYVETAYRKGVAQGYNNQFHPNANVTREEMVTMLMRAIPEFTPTGNADAFADDENISDWAKSAVYAAKNLGLVNGVGNNEFAPKANTLRADMSVLFYNLLKMIEQ